MLTIPPFRRLALGAIISSVGDGMSAVAVTWLALDLAASGQEGMAVGLALGAFTLPSAIAGTVFASHANRVGARRLILLGSGTRGCFFTAIAVLSWAGVLTLPIYVVLLAASSLFIAWGVAGRTTMIAAVVDEPLRMSANSLLMGQSQLALIVGPGVAGVLIHFMGAATVLAVDAVTFGAMVVVALTLPNPTTDRKSTAAKTIRIWRVVDVRTLGLIGLTLAFYLLYGPFEVAMPLRVTDLGGDARTYGVLLTAFAIGALLGNVAAGALPRLEPRSTSLLIIIGWGAAVVVAGIAGAPVIVVAAIAVGGFIYGPHPAMVTTVIQREVPAADLPRFSATWTSSIFVVTPLGTLAGGPLASSLGAASVLVASGVATITLGVIGLLWLARGWLTRAPNRSPEAAS